MGLFGKSKEDTSQDAQIQQLKKDLATCWSWIQQHEKNQQILIKNNNSFLKKHKAFTSAIQQLQAKDQQHDAKDQEHDALIKGIKDMAKAVDMATEGG